MDVSAPVIRLLNAISWAMPLLVGILVAPWDRTIVVNLPFILTPPFVVLCFMVFLELRQPELVATAGAASAYMVWANFTPRLDWFGYLVLLPGLVAGAALSVKLSRRSTVSATLVVASFAAPLLGALAEYAVLVLLPRD